MAPQTFGRSGASERGSAVIVVMALIAILLLYVAANLRTLNHLHRELKLLEQKQVRRLRAAAPSTNSVALTFTNLLDSSGNQAHAEPRAREQNHRH